MKLGLAATVAALVVVVGPTAGNHVEAADLPGAKLESALGGNRGEVAAARWYDGPNHTFLSTDIFESTNATTAFNFPPITGTGVVCPTGASPGSPCSTAATPVGADVYGLVIVQTIAGIAMCRCVLP